jgi:SP family general alpha glucoside:H+ symporter-like MFS transporter
VRGLNIRHPYSLITGHLQGGICFLCIIYTYYRVPEPAGRTFAELDLLFERGVSARNFSSTTVDVFAMGESEKVVETILHKKDDRLTDGERTAE